MSRKISYNFQGYDLTEWAEYGGLPVWVGSGDATMVARTETHGIVVSSLDGYSYKF